MKLIALIRWIWASILVIGLSIMLIEFDWVSAFKIQISDVLRNSINGIIIGGISLLQLIWLWMIHKFAKHSKGVIVE